jgi:hypothetical protein
MTGHYPRGRPTTTLFVRDMPPKLMARFAAFCVRNRVSYREALVAIIPAGIRALTGKKDA